MSSRRSLDPLDLYDVRSLLSAEERMVQEAVARLVDERVLPIIQQHFEEHTFPRELVAELAALGLLGSSLEGYGCAGMNAVSYGLICQELERGDSGLRSFVSVQSSLVMFPIHAYGSDAQKERWLPAMARGEAIGCFGLTEPHGGADPVNMKTHARRDGDDWVLNGTKLWITNGGEAEIFVIFATVDPSKGHKGITTFIVEKDFEGFTVGKKEDKLGIRASSTTELILENCRVPGGNVLGEVGKGYKVAIETLNVGRIGIGAQMIGVARGALDATRTYVMEREQFGKPIGSFQAVQFQLAQAATELEAARLLVYNAARLRDARQPYTLEAAMAKLYSSQMAERVTSLCVDLYGGYGYTKEYPVEKYWRDSKIGAIYEGTSNMQLQTIGKMLLG